jgi:hypothetical protein
MLKGAILLHIRAVSLALVSAIQAGQVSSKTFSVKTVTKGTKKDIVVHSFDSVLVSHTSSVIVYYSLLSHSRWPSKLSMQVKRALESAVRIYLHKESISGPVKVDAESLFVSGKDRRRHHSFLQ